METDYSTYYSHIDAVQSAYSRIQHKVKIKYCRFLTYHGEQFIDFKSEYKLINCVNFMQCKYITFKSQYPTKDDIKPIVVVSYL